MMDESIVSFDWETTNFIMLLRIFLVVLFMWPVALSFNGVGERHISLTICHTYMAVLPRLETGL